MTTGTWNCTWGIVNAGSGNPYRIWVYEHAGGDSDNFGIENPTTGKWEPNSVWTITDTDGKNIRPVSWEIVDIDNDGVDEIIFAGRKSDMTFGVCSVDNIPDDGDGSETWTMEYSQLDVASYGGDNKWDVAVIGNNAYLFDEVVISKVSWDGSAYTYSEMSPLAGGISFDASQVCDVDSDGIKEIITGEYSYGDGSKSIWLLKESGDTLAHHRLFDINTIKYLNGGRIVGGDMGDLDNDGNVDFVFGSRFSGPPNAMIFRLEYRGYGEITNALNWELSYADTGYAEGGMWSVIEVANIDDDDEDEVLYTSSYGDITEPLVMLDNAPDKEHEVWNLIPRGNEIEIPDVAVNNGCIGNMISGVDVDGDGAKEIYMINDNSNDTDVGELVPRIYKLEWDGSAYVKVWEANAQDFDPTITQNTWPPLSLTDLDDDGNMELTWGIVNAGSGNPYRIWVYEHAGGDSDNFGIENPTTGKWEPNSVWTITDTDGKNIRPVSWEIVDIDDDGVDEIIFAGRKSDMTFGVCSVDNIPDDGDGSETWTLEYSQLDVASYGGDNKWDVAVIDANAYLFDEVVISKVTWDGSAYGYMEMDPLPGGISFDASQVCDVDSDGIKEIITGEYSYGDGSRHIWLLKESGDTLEQYPLFNVNTTLYLNGGRIVGGDMGDIDDDGNTDFVFGSRFSGPPNAMIMGVEYQGSGEITNPLNWQMTVLDTGYSEGGMWSAINVSNIDDDVEDEVLYTSTYGAETEPVVVLDRTGTGSAIREMMTPSNFELGQAYPNPFNPQTVIPFTLKESGYVSLKVYSVTGGLVETLLHGNMDAGHYEINFDASGLASGVYLYQLQLDNTFRAGKMILSK
ncbi:MAG: T9SS type A sorting domain-containing protein [Candidatus Marinimicrobia bacterium]|nr:T9SS type A sorting domain-containing protein [Candidatus Neomarinimicrobiota bacterium]